MATFLRPLSYRYLWLYNSISRLSALTVGGEAAFHRLPWQGLTLPADAQILDLCCGSGQATRYLLEIAPQVTGLDVSPRSLDRARRLVPQAQYVQGAAENLPFGEGSFDLVHSSAALHEMTARQRDAIFDQVYRVLKPGGWFIFVDFHRPHNPLMWPGIALFFWLFETETAWEWLTVPAVEDLGDRGFTHFRQTYAVGGSLQVIQAQKPA